MTVYPVRKIVIEFQGEEVFANGRKYKDIDELIQWIKDMKKVINNPFINNSA